MLYLFVVFLFLLLVLRRRLLLVLILLEIIGFVLIFYISYGFNSSEIRDYLVLLGFAVLVIEGVIALYGLILLVSFRGRDYLVSSSIIKL